MEIFLNIVVLQVYYHHHNIHLVQKVDSIFHIHFSLNQSMNRWRRSGNRASMGSGAPSGIKLIFDREKGEGSFEWKFDGDGEGGLRKFLV